MIDFNFIGENGDATIDFFAIEVHFSLLYKPWIS